MTDDQAVTADSDGAHSVSSCSPFYGEDFYCEIPRSFRHLSFYIFDRDVFRRDSIIGRYLNGCFLLCLHLFWVGSHSGVSGVSVPGILSQTAESSQHVWPGLSGCAEQWQEVALGSRLAWLWHPTGLAQAA